MKRLTTISAALAITVLSLLPADALARESEHESTSGGSIGVSLAPCADGKFNLLGGKVQGTFGWSYKASTTPAGLGTNAVVKALKRSFANITGAHNDCGRADNVSATARYDGTTTRGIGVTAAGRCGAGDGRNTVGFGDLPSGVLAVTCTRFIGNQIVEADIRVNTRFSWATSVASCFGHELIEPTMTHEIGHAFGLGHVGENKHGRLTMSTQSDGPCSNAESTLGLGDMRGLEQLY